MHTHTHTSSSPSYITGGTREGGGAGGQGTVPFGGAGRRDQEAKRGYPERQVPRHKGRPADGEGGDQDDHGRGGGVAEGGVIMRPVLHVQICACTVIYNVAAVGG